MTNAKDPLIEEVSDAIQRMARAWKFYPEVWLELNLTTVQLKSLLYIDYMGSTNFRNLSDALGVTPPSITEVIDRLVERGLVSREENPENRRMLILKTTAEGRALMAKLTETRRSIMNSLLEQLDRSELVHLARIFTTLANSIENGTGKPPEEYPRA
jgi:DNA-binding MarR family transcriptional regulator